jgi:hypothetical protein
LWKFFGRKPEKPSGKFQYLGHSVQANKIDLWVKFPDGSTDLFRIPLEKGLLDQFEIAKQAERQGIRVIGEFIDAQLRLGII